MLIERLSVLTAVKIIISVADTDSQKQILHLYNTYLADILIECLYHGKIENVMIMIGHPSCVDFQQNTINLNIENKEHLFIPYQPMLRKTMITAVNASHSNIKRVWKNANKREAMINRSFLLVECFRFHKCFQL